MFLHNRYLNNRLIISRFGLSRFGLNHLFRVYDLILKCCLCRYNERRGRLAYKLEFIAFDPVVQQEVLYKEQKKVRSIQEPINTWYNKPSVLKSPELTEDDDKKAKK